MELGCNSKCGVKMAKGILEFNLPEEEKEFEHAAQYFKAYKALWDMDAWLRNQLKYKDLKPTARKTLQEVREEFVDLVGNLLEDM